MKQRILKGTRNYQGEKEELLELSYYMIEKPINPEQTYYGIEIKAGTEYDQLLLSQSKEWVEELIDKFIGNGVTPGTMAYIIDDIMEIPC